MQERAVKEKTNLGSTLWEQIKVYILSNNFVTHLNGSLKLDLAACPL